MKTKTAYLIISLCYAYFAGIVAEMLFPVAPSALPVFLGISVVGLGLCALVLFLMALDVIKKRKWFLPFAIFTLLIFGYTRHLASRSVIDKKVASVTINNSGKIDFKTPIDFSDSSRIQLVKKSETFKNITIKISGKLFARVAEQNTNGISKLNSEDKWEFRILNTPVESEPIIIKASDPIGKIYYVKTTFNQVTKINCINGSGPAKLEILRVANHTSTFARKGQNRPAVTVLGKITHDPYVYSSRTSIQITPDFIQYEAGGPYYKSEGGDVKIFLRPSDNDYKLIARTQAYGYYVQVHGELRKPLGPANPGDFDQKTYMRNHNLFGTLFIKNYANGFPGISVVKNANGKLAKGNSLAEFSLNLRDKMLLIIKQTLPMPDSAFVGAVTLGMRYGLADKPCFLSDFYKKNREGFSREEYENSDDIHYGCDETIAEEFKRSGVNHVLAVSGLHVTIITAMFVGIFSLLKIPKKMFVPIIIFALVVFAIITGARPSTLRAVIMNSLTILAWAYLQRGLRSAALLGVGISGLLILIHNPLMIIDPSFTLSFGAILSLVLITGPAYEQLSKLRGNQFLVFILFMVISTVLAIRKFALFYTLSFVLLWCAVWLIIFYLAKLLEKKIKLIGDTGFADLPTGFSTFFAAQFSIQIGMMIPLTAIYFMRWPFGGMFANIIAIPLIGVVIQLGMLGGLLGMIPGIGIYFSLVLGAANWFFSTLFLYISHAVAGGFPFPFVKKYPMWAMVLYYSLCLGFVYRKPLMKLLRTLLEKFDLKKIWYGRVAVVVLFLLLAVPLFFGKNPDEKKLRISVLSVRYGSSILVQTPNGANLLFDGGAVVHGQRGFNNAIRTILPFLGRQGILKLDAAVLMSPNIQRSAGMADVVHETRVKKLFVPDSIFGINSKMSQIDFEKFVLNGQEYSGPETLKFRKLYKTLIKDESWPDRLSLLKALNKRGKSFINNWADLNVKVLPLKKGQIIWEETEQSGKKLLIESLYPDGHVFKRQIMDNNSPVVKITYGDFSVLLTGDLHYDGQKYLSEKFKNSEKLKANIFLVPGHGVHLPSGPFRQIDRELKQELYSSLIPLVEKVSPEVVVLEYGDPRSVLPETYRDARSAYEITFKFLKDNFPKKRILSTSNDQAILITSTGEGFKLKTQAESQPDSGETVGEGASDIGYAF